MAIGLLLFAVGGSVSGFTVGGGSGQTHDVRRMSTKSYVGSQLQTERTAKMDDEASSEVDRWLFPRPKVEVQKINKQEVPVSADEQAVDEYLEFLDRRYR